MRRVAVVAAWLLLALWAAWWFVALGRLALPLAERSWMSAPAFGADFWSQSDYAARLWRGGVDPYENERHLFHYPPIVIRLFLWTPFFSVETALRIWVVVLAALVVAGVVLAHRTRRMLGAGDVPLPVLLVLVLYGFPVVYALERANFDLVTLAAILLAVPLLSLEHPWAEFLAGAFLAFGPWVKIYPGFLAFALVGLQRFRALGGFVVCGAVVFAAMPGETLRSFQLLRMAIERVDAAVSTVPFAVWSHSLSIGWIRLVDTLRATPLHGALSAVRGSVAALAAALTLVVPVCHAVYRSSAARALAYPLLLWVVAVASFVPEIANDYSLVFLPLAAAATLGRGDGRLVAGAVLASVVSYQPFALPLPGALLLVTKALLAVAVGVSLARRAAQPVLAEGAAVGAGAAEGEAEAGAGSRA